MITNCFCFIIMNHDLCDIYDQNKVGDLLQPVAKLVGDVTRDLHKLVDPKVRFDDHDDDAGGGGHDNDDDDVIAQAGEPVCRWEKKKWCEPVSFIITIMIIINMTMMTITSLTMIIMTMMITMITITVEIVMVLIIDGGRLILTFSTNTKCKFLTKAAYRKCFGNLILKRIHILSFKS